MNGAMLMLRVLVVSLLFALTASGDGLFIVRDDVPPKMPYQRALIVFDGTNETLLVQSAFEQRPGMPPAVGWVVPVPSVPELASMRADDAEFLFTKLNNRTQPQVIGVTRIVLMLVPLLSLMGLIISFFPKRVHGVTWFSMHRGVFIKTLVYSILPALFFSLVVVECLSHHLEVIKTEKAGIYDVQVVRADQPAALVQWLNTNGFRFGAAEHMAVEQYISQAWCFVVAKIDARVDLTSREAMVARLAAPLILRFKTNQPVYPLALTTCAGAQTEMLLYLLAPEKVVSDKPLALRSAYPVHHYFLLPEHMLAAAVTPANFWRRCTPGPLFLCKFKGRLTPAQMRSDLYFSRAPDQESYTALTLHWF